MKGLMDGFLIGDSGIMARLFRPHGPEKCPLVVIFHGFPGIELNYDIAYALREAGCAALVPHYSGSWGSKGDFRVEGLTETVALVLRHAKSEPFANRYGIDPARIAVAGHSMGGMLAVLALEIDPEVRGVVAIDPSPLKVEGPRPPAKAFESRARLLSGATAEQIVAGIGSFCAKWDPFRSIETLGNRFFMLVAASVPGAVTLPLEPAIELARKAQAQNPDAELWVLASDHAFVSQRPLLRELVVKFVTARL
jgi:pimeloyl-ACP methyl ester carboxylesterase